MYHEGDNVFSNLRVGLCTLGGEIVTDWPDLFLSCGTPDGRVYFVEHDGVCSTYDQDFDLIISVPELGSGAEK